METTEKRFYNGSVKIEQRDDSEKSDMLVGYAAVFDKWSKPMNMDVTGRKFIEKIDKRAFDNILDSDSVVVFNHDQNIILGRNKVTAELFIDDTGLGYRCDFPDSPNGQNVRVGIERGDITGSSFRFSIPKGGSEWIKSEKEGIFSERTIKEVNVLVDVGPVTYPAYSDSSTAVSTRDYTEPKPPTTPERELLKESINILRKK